MVPVTPSFFRLLLHLQPTSPKDGYHNKGQTPRPCPFEDLTPISWLALLTDNFVAPGPDCPNGVALEPKLFVP
jgi:hypothetical protein